MMLWKAENALSAGCGMLLGGFLAYLLMDLTIYLGRCNDSGFHLFPWPPFFGLPPVRALGILHRIAARILSWIAKVVFRLPDNIFNNPPQDTILKDDHLFAGLSLIEVSSAYLAVYWLLKPGSWTQLFQINSVPPAAFIYALLLPLIWLISAFWVHFKRYRIMLLSGILIGVTLYSIGGTRYVEETIGGSAHTYDVLTIARPEPLAAEEVLQPLQNLKYEDGKKSNLIIVAASGGGILAAGWTTKVLTELHKEYRHFPEELRLVSAVSGGSVGTVHYVSAFSEDRGGVGLSEEELQRIVKDAMKSSLSITSYGFAFPDFRRALFPLWTDETFDRARLLEADWRHTVNDHQKKPPDTETLLSHWTQAIRAGKKPAVILNSTVMETGERIAITPIASLENFWAGLTRTDGEPCPPRRIHARTLAEFLGQSSRYDVDVWTAARLSATFSYVSLAARASFVHRSPDGRVVERRLSPIPSKRKDDNICLDEKGRESNGLLHLIDGGYHDNSGVASALDWLTAALARWKTDLPFSRIALVEIRAKPDIPQEEASNQWESA